MAEKTVLYTPEFRRQLVALAGKPPTPGVAAQNVRGSLRQRLRHGLALTGNICAIHRL